MGKVLFVKTRSLVKAMSISLFVVITLFYSSCSNLSNENFGKFVDKARLKSSDDDYDSSKRDSRFRYHRSSKREHKGGSRNVTSRFFDYSDFFNELCKSCPDKKLGDIADAIKFFIKYKIMDNFIQKYYSVNYEDKNKLANWFFMAPECLGIVNNLKSLDVREKIKCSINNLVGEFSSIKSKEQAVRFWIGEFVFRIHYRDFVKHNLQFFYDYYSANKDVIIDNMCRSFFSKLTTPIGDQASLLIHLLKEIDLNHLTKLVSDAENYFKLSSVNRDSQKGYGRKFHVCHDSFKYCLHISASKNYLTDLEGSDRLGILLTINSFYPMTGDGRVFYCDSMTYEFFEIFKKRSS